MADIKVRVGSQNAIKVISSISGKSEGRFPGDLTVEGNTFLGNDANDLVSVIGITTFVGNITQTGTFTNRGGGDN